jgi:hypothetical protein
MPNEEFSREMDAIERLIESAVTLSWEDLATSFAPLAMQVEYQRRPDRALEHMKLWSSTSRGHWNLVCEYWMHSTATHSQGVTFTDTYSSAALTRMLNAIMQNQQSLALPHGDFANKLVQIAPPNKTRSIAAKHLIVEMLERITSRSSAGTVTAAMRSAAGHPTLLD